MTFATRIQAVALFVGLMTVMLLPGCGGSDGDRSAPDAADVSSPNSAAAPAPAPAPATTAPTAPTDANPESPPTHDASGRLLFYERWFFNGRSEAMIGLQNKPAPPLVFDGWLGDPDQAAELQEAIGREGDLSRLRGKIVVVFAWTVQSGPCLKAIKRNNDLLERFRDQDVVLLSLHLPNADRSLIAAALDSHEATFPTALDVPGDTPETAGKGRTEASWGLSIFPAYMLIDERGVVRAAGVLTSKVSDAVEALIDERAQFAETE